MLSVLSVFAGPYALIARWVVIALLVAAFGGWAWVKGNAHGTQKLNDYVAKQVIEAVRIAQGRERITTQVVTKYIQVQGKTRTVTEYVDREVVKYAEANPGFCLDAAWRVLHDSAAANLVPDPGLKPDATSGAPKAAEALETVTANYSACHRTTDRLDALQDWIRKQQAVK